LLNGVSFLAVLWALTRMHYPEEPRTAHPSYFTSLRQGFTYLRGNPQMLVLVWMIAAASFLGIPFLTFIPYFARMVLHTGETGLGWLFAASGLGAVLGAVTVAAMGSLPHRGKVITFAGISFFSAIVAFSYSHIFVLSQCLLLVEGYSGILMISGFNVAVQHLSNDEMRGRIMSIYVTCFLGFPPLGALLAGELSRHIATPRVLAAMAVIAAVIFIAIFSFSRDLRELD
jgi:predicted MFS family arabinose efflux permease